MDSGHDLMRFWKLKKTNASKKEAFVLAGQARLGWQITRRGCCDGQIRHGWHGRYAERHHVRLRA